MSSLTLYHMVPSRSAVARWMLEEIGQPYDLHILSGKKGENRAPAYLAVNPMGKVPALKHGDAIITESAAICCYLADTFPDAGLNVPVGDVRRGPYLKWMFFGPSCFEPALLDHAFKRPEPVPRSTAGYGDYDTVLDVMAKAVEKGPFILGDKFTAADVVIGSGLRWGMLFKLVPERAEFVSYVKRLEERPALRRATEKDAEIAEQQKD